MVTKRYRLASLTLAMVLGAGSSTALAQHNSSTTDFPRPNDPVSSPRVSSALQQAYTLSQQAIDLYQAGRYGEAIPLATEALAIYREQLGDRHPFVATSLNNLAELYRAQGRYGEAEPRHLEALAIRRQQLGDGQGPVGDHRHPDVAQSLNNLAELYHDQGRYGEAEPLYLESLAIRRQQLGDGQGPVGDHRH
ncbi:MAG: tetratricopeptide repeat protein, partial [Cyanobacteria bacterium]|nr:tetratricopeptide repeat protein [Cyanobacteriota bacterium]